MAIDGDFANFRAVYDEMTDEVMRARSRTRVERGMSRDPPKTASSLSNCRH
jgi:hypothetical protein